MYVIQSEFEFDIGGCVICARDLQSWKPNQRHTLDNRGANDEQAGGRLDLQGTPLQDCHECVKSVPLFGLTLTWRKGASMARLCT